MTYKKTLKYISVVVALLLTVALGGCITDGEPEGTLVFAGDKVPQFTVTLNDGSNYGSADLIEHGGTIVFFNTDCADCRRELPELQQRYEQGRNIVCIARQEGAASIAAFWKANALTMPWSAQDDASVYHIFAESGIPRIYVVAVGGTVTEQYLGE